MNPLYVVGIGPGEYKKMTIEAAEILHDCDVIAGYAVYVDLMRKIPAFADKEYIVTGMRQEKERCRLALLSALEGKKTALVCSGDAGVYGMAGILMELKADTLNPDDMNPEIRVVAGVTAALSGAAVLGAPLGHDFSVVSLSDLLTPWEKIEKRLRCAAMSDFVICLYNPSSRSRKEYLRRACELAGEYRRPDTVCGYVKNIGRAGQKFEILTLRELKEVSADMFTTVFIGNSMTKRIGDQMVTPRGYLKE